MMTSYLKLAAIYVGIVFALLNLGGCNQNPHTKRIEVLDSLQTAFAKTYAIFDSIDYDRHHQNRADMMKDIERIEGHFRMQQDTMPRDLALKLSEYRLVWKGYKRMDGEYQKVKEALDDSKEQLATLKTDLENNAISETLGKRFLQEELEVFRNLDLGARSFSIKMKRTEKYYKEQKPAIVLLADSLSNSTP